MDAIELVMETGFAISAFVAMFLNMVLPEEVEEGDAKHTSGVDPEGNIDSIIAEGSSTMPIAEKSHGKEVGGESAKQV